MREVRVIPARLDGQKAALELANYLDGIVVELLANVRLPLVKGTSELGDGYAQTATVTQTLRGLVAGSAITLRITAPKDHVLDLNGVASVMTDVFEKVDEKMRAWLSGSRRA